MPHHDLQYLPAAATEALRPLVEQFCAGTLKLTPQELLQRVTALLPVEKLNRTTLIQRVEGYYYVGELLWKELLVGRKLDRNDVIRMAGIKSLGYYHHKLGSREPGDLVVTRNDYFTDPPTALEKLGDDIVGLAQIVLTENAKAPHK
jgi:hypothetical protein